MRKTGLYIILGIIISLTVFVLAGILYFQPQTAVQPEVVRPMVPEKEPVSVPLQKEPAAKEAVDTTAPVPAESVPDAEVDIQVPPPVALSMKVTPYVPPVEFVEVEKVAEAEQAAPVESVQMEFIESVQEEVAELQEGETGGELVEELILPEEAEGTVAPEMKEEAAELEVDQAAEEIVAPEMEEEAAELEIDQAAEEIIAPETVIEEEEVATAEVPAAKAPVTAETAPSPQKKEAAADEALIEKKLTAEPVEEFTPEVFTPSGATLWIVKNSMPVLFAPEILVAPEPYEGGEPEFVSPGSFLSTAEDKRRDAVDSLFDSLQF